ncbi:DNA-dependent protein kinase catalytic subunit-like isoform X2 [Anthonomus grandis grandis]|uniref:DNA-dependent protein kinase catalytic subunit-like isoform X2 n=1 Tax=Anthonomus grandis grandis TaxID=2921223 RepID=UPI0021657ADB|nr:DNA-dependent protein kinase catalytic subunit-like isoform X2 [Anthonomus grandis grandis]
MDIEPQNFFQILWEHSRDNLRGPTECQRLLAILNYNLTEEQLNESLIDLYLLHLFDQNVGLFKFLLDVCSNSKFDNASSKALEIIYTLINNFPRKVEEYILDINDKCLRMLQVKAAAKVKTRILDVLLISIEKIDKCLENQQRYMDLYHGINFCLKQEIHPDSVRSKEFILIGLLCKRLSYLEGIIQDSENIKKYFYTQLDKQMFKGKLQSQYIIHGIFTGLSYFCEGFPLNLNLPENAVIAKKLYDYIETLSNITCDVKIRVGNRAAIAFLASNMKIFMKSVVTKYKQWHKKLLMTWLSSGLEEKKAGEECLRILLLNMAETIARMNKDECLPMLKHFIGWFKVTLKNTSSTYVERKLCLQGLKYFCEPMHKHYTKGEAREVFILIMEIFEKSYILNSNFENEEWEFLPEYVQCLASFMRFQRFSNSEIYCLQRAVISMIKTFYRLKPLHHLVVIDALVTTLFYLKDTKEFNAFLESTVYQGVVWSCSHQHLTESELETEDTKIITVKNYFPLWRGLLKLVSNRSYDKVGIYFSDREFILIRIVQELVKTLRMLVDKLNVNVKLNEDSIQTDIESVYQVEQASDYAIFLNVTDFYQDIFEHADANMFEHCICKIINHMVGKCLKYPLVSGFYKLLSYSLKIGNTLRLFEKNNITLNQDVNNCKENLAKFVSYLLHKMKQFKDELLIACLHVLMECPVVVIEPVLATCTGIFTTIFEVGRSYITLANLGLSTLARWQNTIKKEEFEEFLVQVIPCLDSYLRSRSLGVISSSNTAVEKKRKTARQLKRRAVGVELEPELVKFQKRVLHFVGNQNSKVCKAFVAPDVNFERKVTSDTLHLKVVLPYNDMALEIFLEPFIMRVVELSQYSSDRKTRIMACELLQAFVVVFLGRTKLMATSGLIDLEELLRSIALPLLQLACDMDQVVRQIFEPLFMQLIHWYTFKVNKQSLHLQVIVEVLMEGITHPTNSSLRDFSGKCINEFVKWTIKQTSENELKSNPINIKILVKRMRFFSLHPDLVKKLGAALIFNNIYKEIREERAIISIFAVELLHIFVCSLALLEYSNEEVDNTVHQINKAISHLKRIFLERAEMFRRNDDKRRIPSDIPNENLTGLTTWLLTMTGSRSKYCRNICMELFVHFQPLCDQKMSMQKFVQTSCPNILEVYEEHIKKHPLTEANFTETSIILLKWLQSLLCLIDGYIFVIKNGLVIVDLDDKLEAIEYFLINMQTLTVEQALKLIYKSLPLPYCTSENKEQFIKLKSLCNLAILKLAQTILNNNEVLQKNSSFWSKQSVYYLIRNSIFYPNSLGFDEQFAQQEYRDILLILLNNFPRKLEKSNVIEVTDVLKKYLADSWDLEIDLNKNVSLKQRSILKGLLLIHSSQLDLHFNTLDYSKGLITKLISNFYKNLDQNTIYIGRLSEATTEYLSLILQFSLSNKQEFLVFLGHLNDKTNVRCQELTDVGNNMPFGLYLVSMFADTVVKFLLDDFDAFLDKCDDVEMTIKITRFIMKYIENNKTAFKDRLSKICEGLLTKWFIFQMYFEENSIDLGLDFVKQFCKIFAQFHMHFDDLQTWVFTLIGKEEMLLSEQEGLNLYLSIFNATCDVVIDDIEGLSTALEILQVRLEPYLSTQSLTEKLLSNLPNVKNVTILTFLIEFYLKNIQSIKDTDLSELLKNFMARNAEVGQQLNILNAIYRLSVNVNKTFDQKKLLVHAVLPSIFNNSNHTAFCQFFKENIEDIKERLQSGNLNRCVALVDFLLVELLFLRVPIGCKEKEGGEFDEVAGTNLRNELLKVALGALRDNTNEDSAEYQRVYKCSAYKALASIITNSIKSISFYQKLFVRQENGQDILWSSLIDTTVNYTFPVDFDSYPKKRKVLVNIRDGLRQERIENKSKSLKYIESQRLFTSSLNEDVTKFDFTSSVLRTSNRSNIEGTINNDDTEVSDTKIIQGEIYLEATEINNHELMATVCGIVEHIFSTGINRLPEDPDDMVEFPPWMEGIVQLLLNPATHKNIKIFWVKVIDNMVHIFRHFAKYFMLPLLQFLDEKIAGDDLNYFVTDVIVILASWTSLVTPTEKEIELASNLLNHMTKTLTNERREMFKYNLDLIKLFVENWRSVEVPYASLGERFKIDSEVEVGIHLASIFLVNGHLPCKESDINTFWSKLTKVLSSSDKPSIYKPCAETTGLMLKYLKENDLELSNFSANLIKMIMHFWNTNINKYAGCLEGITIHYPEIVDNHHILKLLNRLSQSEQSLQTIFLKVIFKRADILGDIDSFKTEDWSKYLESQNAEVQLITLEIILKTFSYFKDVKTLLPILKSICKNLLNPNVFCRSKMYDILMAILKNEDITDEDVVMLCKEILIQGLTDSDLDIRAKIREFWSKYPEIPSNISGRFSYLLSNFYLAKVEEHFLGYVSYFLLNSLEPEECKKSLFEHPLEDCDFEEYQLQTNWRLQHPSVVPLFAETLRTFTAGLDDGEVSSSNLGQLRATQDNFSFAPTQQSLRDRHISQITGLESSLTKSSLNDSAFLNPNALQLSQRYKLPKRRFLRDKVKIAAGFAHLAVEEKIKKFTKRYEEVKEREKKVTIYRSYRKGDFPDIQIALDSLIKPLQMLVMHDSELSKILSSTVYKALKEKLKDTNEDFTIKVAEGIRKIFTSSTSHNVNVFSTLLDILLKSKKEIRLDPALISRVCQQSGLISVGTLLIEEYIMNLEDVPTSSKRGTGAENLEMRHWLKLAELYKELNEWNLVRTIFLEKSNCKEDVHKGITMESQKRWREAQETYEKLLNIDFSIERQDFYYESYFKCLAHLGEWEKVPRAVDALVPEGGENTWDSLWDNDWYQQKILPWYLEAHVKNILFSPDVDCKTFLENINKSLTTPEQAEYMKNKFSEQLCILWLTQKDAAQANQYLKFSMDNFLLDWQLLNPMFGSLRYSKILDLRTLVEIKRFLDTDITLTNNDSAEQGLKILMDYWKTTKNEYLPSIILSESQLLYRKLFSKLLADKMTALGQFEMVKELKKTNILLDIAFMNLAVNEENYYMTRKYYKEYANMKHPSLTMICGHITYLYANLCSDYELKLKKLLDSLKKFKEVAESSRDEKATTSLLKIFDISQKITELFVSKPEFYEKLETDLTQIFGGEESPPDVAARALKDDALKGLDNGETYGVEILKEKINALVKLAYFVQNSEDQEADFALFVLKAMKLGSREARQLFPCILMKDSLENELRELFLRESQDVPIWMFLGWIPQLLANVDTPKIAAISEIILKIAKTYPQAIIYSYRLSKENFSNTDNLDQEETKNLIDELDRLLLSDSRVDKFLEALSKVSVPLSSIYYHLNKMFSATSIGAMMEAKDAIMNFYFKEISDTRGSNNMQGNMYKKLKDLKSHIEKITIRTPIEKAKDIIKELEQKRKILLSSSSESKLLKDYCPWLANFSAGKFNLELEIPGQYTGEKIPLVQHHIKISGFTDQVSVMSSLRKPIKITMIGMDSKEYPFLVKFGEDIRQDQRIQQLFALMNSIFASDNKTHQVLTYQVVPLTTSLGIIQWVDHTISLKNFMSKTYPINGAIERIRKKYKQFLVKGDSDMEIYGLTAKTKNKEITEPFFYSLVREIPLDVLRKSIWSVSLTTESFIAFKENFIKSYAALCACQWLLGIGDRHLENSKVCIRNGKILGIDFGHAFGTATQCLSVPELVPIRLTPHIVGLMEPLKEKGSFRDVLLDCLQSLRDNKAPLVATMNVFITEPSVDWLETANRIP